MWVQIPHGNGQFWAGKANHCKVYGYCAFIWSDQGAIWVVVSDGPKELCFRWGSRSPHGNGQFWGIGGAIVKYRDFLPWAVQSRLNRSICCLGCGLHWAEDAQGQSCSPGGANVSSWEDTCHHLANTIEPSVCNGDAPYIILLWPFVIFGHAHLDSCRDSRALQAKYSSQINTVLWAFHTIQPSG